MIPVVKIKKLPDELQKTRFTELLNIASDPEYEGGKGSILLRNALVELPGSNARKLILMNLFNTYVSDGWIEPDKGGWVQDQLFLFYAINFQTHMMELVW